jgi:hypothetical protein
MSAHDGHQMVSTLGNLGGKKTEFVLCVDCQVIVSQRRLGELGAR